MPQWKAVCVKASCKHVEYYEKNPGHPRCPRCGSMMVPKKTG